MKTLSCTQGSQEWLSVRTKHFTASEAAAMLGLSKYTTRQALLAQKSTGYTEDADENKQRLYDRGHEAESAARPIVERIIEAELYPTTGTAEIESLPLLASFDGITMDDGIVWEHKLLNSALAASVDLGEVPDAYWPQLEQQLLVSGAEKAYFVTSDGTAENMHGCWYISVPARRSQLIAAWKQFAEDLANYQHIEVIPAAVATPTLDLPAVSVQVSGSIALISNLDVFGARLGEFIAGICTEPSTDQEFSDCDAAIKTLEKAEAALKSAESSALAQTASIDDMRRAVALYADQSRTMRLKIEKLVKQRKESIKIEIQHGAQSELAKHLAILNARIGQNLVPPYDADFAGCMKGLKSIDSIRNKVSVELANAKIATSATADRIEINIKTLGDKAFLFPDLQAVCAKSAEDFAALLFTRQAIHQDAEDKKVAARVEQELATKSVATAPASATASAAPPSIARVAPSTAPKVTAGNINELTEAIVSHLAGFEADNLKLVLHYCEKLEAQQHAAA